MKKTLSLLLAAVATVGLSGCGASSPPTPSAADASAAPSPAVKAEIVTVGIGNILAPQFYVDESGKLVGYDVDVLKAVDELLPQYEFKFEQMEFSSLLVSLQADKIDIADFQLTKTAEREETYRFPTEQYDVANTVLIVGADNPDISGLEDMAGRSIAQMPTSNFYKLVDDYNTENPNATVDLQAIDSLPVADALQMVADGRIDGTICLKSTFNSLKDTLGLDLKVGAVLETYPVYWILQKDDAALQADIDSALAELKQNGNLSEISVKWYGEDVFKN